MQQLDELSHWMNFDQAKFLVLEDPNDELDGTTALARSVARNLQDVQTSPPAVLYFRCLESDERRSRLRPLMMTLLAQAIRQNRSFDRYDISGSSHLFSKDRLTDLELEQLLQSTIKYLKNTFDRL